MRAALSALLAALAEGAGGDAGRRAVAELARRLERGPGASAELLAEAAGGPDGREVLRGWGERVAELLADDPQAAGAVATAMERLAPGSGALWYGGDHADFSGGVFLDKVVGLQVVIQQRGAAAAPEVLASLPPRPGGFTGRAEEIAELLRALDDSAAVLVTAVSGLGGIGKTALAVEAAYLACGNGWFPGGVLFVDLHGYDEEPVSADQALQSLVRALGVPPEHIPATTDDRAALYRSVLAERTREQGAVLLLADNASSPDQVRPLLPGDSRHRVLVTSRDRLAQLGARLMPLDQLTPEDAIELIDLAVRNANLEDSRVADDVEAATQLADLCGHLPLALQIAAALLAEDRGMPVAELVEGLESSYDRLLHLDDGERSVRAAFELSYRRLPSEQARLLRLLALAPGPEVSDEVVAVLTGAEASPLRNLRTLARAHLVERGTGRGQWRLHDLVRAFGAAVVAQDVGLRAEGEAARDRVLAFYCQLAEAANDRFRGLPGTPVPERFADRAEALAWLDRERAGLVAAVMWAQEKRFAGMAVQLAEFLAEYLARRRYFDDLISVCGAALGAARRAGDRYREAIALNNLGNALQTVGRAEEAVGVLTLAGDLHNAAGNRVEEASTWVNLGIVLQESGRAEEAVETLTRAGDLCRAAGDRAGEADAWVNLGIVLQTAGRAGEAVETLTRARDLFQAVEDRYGEARAWHSFAMASLAAGRVGDEIEAYCKALEIYLEFQDWYGAGQVLCGLAFAYRYALRPAEARAHYALAADAFTVGNAPAEAAEARALAETLTVAPPPAPTDKPTPASPPAHTTDSAQPAPPPPSAPDTAGP